MRYRITLETHKTHALVDLQGDKHDIALWAKKSELRLPANANTFAQSGPYTLYWIGPERWLLAASLEREPELAQLISENTLAESSSAVLISDSQSFFEIRGADAGQIVSIASPLDIHSSVFPENGASYTDLFGLKALVIRREDGFDIMVERSFSDMVLDYFQRAQGV
ncbi:hypothetical protein AB833_15620 [Chromatiales bacterium (ex Bugula neritina AB1)]|nr:hypothetical protein AB833_15620 [Chromatiales bacterium (ex Bugula neritina AB1)]